MNYPWNQPNGPRQQPNQQYIQPGMNQQYQPPPFQQQQFMSPQQFHPPPNHQIPHYQQPYIAPPPQAMIQPKASTPGGPLIHQGRRRALLIGINYTGQRAQLSGCQNDIRNVRNFITNVYQFPSDPNSMVVLTDDQRNPAFIPTRINIINAMHWLVSAAQPGDEFFFQYSGHGGQADDRDGDEIDGKDETILPLDHQHAGVILDDEMHAIMIRNLPRGARFVAIFDSCHSASSLDLPYHYHPDGRIKERTMISTLGSSIKNTLTPRSVMSGNILGIGMGLVGGVQNALRSEQAGQKTVATRTTQAYVVMFAACKDAQTAADTRIQGLGATGAMSYALIKALGMHPQLSYSQLLSAVRGILQSEYSQVPEFSSGHPLNMNDIFFL